MHAVAARGDEIVVCFYLMSLRLRGSTKPIRNTSAHVDTEFTVYCNLAVQLYYSTTLVL